MSDEWLSEKINEHTELKNLVDSFLEEFWKMKPLDDPVIRDPPSKHQRKLRALVDMVRCFEAKYYLKFKEPCEFLKNEGTKDESMS